MEILFFTSLLFNRLSKVSEKCLLGIFSNFVKYSTNIFRAFFNVPGIILGPWIPMKILPLSLPPRGKRLSRKGGGRGLDVTDVAAGWSDGCQGTGGKAVVSGQTVELGHQGCSAKPEPLQWDS